MSKTKSQQTDVNDNLNFYREYFHSSISGNAIITQDNKWVLFNKQICRILCYSEDELSNKIWLSLIHPDQKNNDSEIFDTFLESKIDHLSFETRLIRGDGITIIGQITLSRIDVLYHDKKCICLQLNDITSQTESEKLLKRNEMLAQRNLEELEWIYSNAPIGLCHFDLDLRYKRVNKFLASINGIPPNAHIGKKIFDLYPALTESAQLVKDTILRSRKPFHQEFRRENPSNSEQTRFFDENWYPLFDEKNSIIGFGAVVEEITEKKHVLALKAADRKKNELLATLAHELRNPIGSVSAALELMRMIDENDPTSSNRDRAPLDRAERQINHMKQLVEDILTVTRVTQGKIELRKQNLDILKTIQQAIEVVHPKLTNKSLILKTNLPANPLFFNYDPMRLTQVIINLLDNAIKFTHKNGTIELSLKQEESDIIIIIRDDGIGIPQKNLRNIFEIFNQIQVTNDKKNEGIGIGLALVRNLVELHGGHVEARSDGLGRGSKFIIKMPINL